VAAGARIKEGARVKAVRIENNRVAALDRPTVPTIIGLAQRLAKHLSNKKTPGAINSSK